MITRIRRTAAAITAVAGLGIGSAVWATSSASAASAATPRCAAGNLAVWVNADSENGATFVRTNQVRGMNLLFNAMYES